MRDVELISKPLILLVALAYPMVFKRSDGSK